MYRIGVGVGGPGEGGTAAERLVAPSESGVDDVFSIAAYGDESAQISEMKGSGGRKATHRPLGLC